MCAGSRRWCPITLSDLVSRYKPEELPPELTAYIKDRKGYDYLHHAEVGSGNAEFVNDEVVDPILHRRACQRTDTAIEGA